MSDPRMPELDDELRELFDAEQRRPGLDAAARARIAAGVRARIAGGGGGPGGPRDGGGGAASQRPASPASGGAGRHARAWLPVATFVAGALAGASLYAAFGPREAPPAVPREAPSAAHAVAAGTAERTRGGSAEGGSTPVVRPAAGAAVAGATAGDRPASATRGPASPLVRVAPAAPGASTSDALARERALVERARTALLRDQAARALDALREHRRRFPRGQLAEERDALTVEALRAAGRAPEARESAEQFRREHPDSLLAPEAE